MSDNISALARQLANNLYASVTHEAAGPHNRFVSTAFFGRWFHSALPTNDYTHMLNDAVPNAQLAPQRQEVRQDTSLHAAKKREPVAAEPDDGRKRIRRVDFTKSANNSSLHSTSISVLRTSTSAQPAVAITTTAYDGRTQIGVDTISKVYGEQHREAIDTLRDTMEYRFASTGNSLVAKIAQTLLVIALETIDPSMELVLNQRLSDALILENLIDIIKSGDQSAPTAREFDDDEEEADFNAERLRDFRRQFNRMSVSPFHRFPELAIECDEASTVTMLRAVCSLWICSKWLFNVCRTLPQKIVAYDMQPKFKVAFAEVFDDRTDLLYAVVVSNIEGIGAQRSEQVRDLFAASLLLAHRQVAYLHAYKPHNTQLEHARSALMRVYRAVNGYRHSKEKVKKNL